MNGSRSRGEEQAPTASKLFVEGIILVGGAAARRKEEHMSFPRRDFNYNKLQKDRSGEALISGRHSTR